MANRIFIGKRRTPFDFKKLVKEHELHKKSRKEAALSANTSLHKTYKATKPRRIVPGNLCLFHYFEPKTKEQLEYYDAEPLTIFFGIANTSQGKRVVGLNLHYYPPSSRKTIMTKILEIYGGLFNSFKRPNRSSIQNFNWKALNSQIINQGLAFGIRMYIPSLIYQVAQIPIESWPTAFYTEGAFKKKSRAAIMKYWKTFRNKTFIKKPD